MESEKKSLIMIKVIYGGLFLLTGALVLGFSYIMGKSYELILRNVIVSLIMAGTIIFMLLDADCVGKEGFSYDNYYKKHRFIVFYIIALILAIAFSLVPNQFWPYMSIFVILALFSNNEIGLVSGTSFVMLSVMLEDHGNYAEMFMYVFAGAVAIAMFRDLKENSEIGFPTFISIVMQAVLLVAFNVLFQNRTLGISLFILPALNLMINLLILLIFLNMFGVYIIRKSKDMYMEINDAEFSLLQALKLKDKDEYFRAIHTAYLAERRALGLGFDPRSVKTCSYYHRIGVIDGKMNWDDVSHYYIENNFPDEAIEFLHEYMVHKKGELRSKEAITVSMSEAVISSIMDLLKQNSEAIIDYDKLIDELFDSKFNSGEIAEYAIYLSEFLKMKKILKKEKLYYGFLRR